MKLDELLNSKYKWDRFREGGSIVSAHFETDDTSRVDVTFAKTGKIWEAEFERDGDQGMTGGGDAAKIFGTVLDILNAFVASYKPDFISFSAKKSEESRVKFYDRFVRKIEAMGFKNISGDDYTVNGEAVVKYMRTMSSHKQYLLVKKSLAEGLEYTTPNFEDEWNEVTHSAELKSYFKTKKNWLKIAQTGSEVTLSRKELSSLDNHDRDLKNLEDEKIDRVNGLFDKGSFELPIVTKDGEFVRLLSGNTRLAVARKKKAPLRVWMINTPDLENYF